MRAIPTFSSSSSSAALDKPADFIRLAKCILRKPGIQTARASWQCVAHSAARQAAGEIEYVGAFIRRRVVGHVVLMLSGVEEYDPYTEGGRCAAASDLHVVEAARGIGVGTALMQFLEERCLARGVAYLALDVNPSDSTTALELYKRLGFEQVSPLHLDGTYNVVDDDGNPSIYEDWCIGMVKRLSPAGR